MTRYYVNAQGNYIGGFNGANPPQGAIEVPNAPNDGRDTWNGQQWVAYVQLKTQFTALEYLDKFTEAEQLSVVTATLANAQVKLWYDKMLAASFVDINDPRTSAGLDALIAANLLAPSRKAEILTPQVIA
jgi:hypothetical protein